MYLCKFLWPFSQKFLQFLVSFSVKNFVREILRAFHKRIRSDFTYEKLFPSNGLKRLFLPLKNISIQNESRFSKEKAYYRPQFINIEWNQLMWCKSAWKLTSQSLHVCKNRSILILTTNIHLLILSELKNFFSIILAKFR